MVGGPPLVEFLAEFDVFSLQSFNPRLVMTHEQTEKDTNRSHQSDEDGVNSKIVHRPSIIITTLSLLWPPYLKRYRTRGGMRNTRAKLQHPEGQDTRQKG